MHIQYRSATIFLNSKDELKEALQAIAELDRFTGPGKPDGEIATAVVVNNAIRTPVAGAGVALMPSLRGKTIVECATTILRERRNEPLHYRDIAIAAMSRGYKGRSDDSKKIARSFAQTLLRLDEFKAVGNGNFRLNDPTLEWGEDITQPLNATH